MTNDSKDLRTLQLRFQKYITGASEDFEHDIVSTEDARAEHRLGAYYNAYRIRLIDCLSIDFKAVQKTIGEEDFEYLVLDYLQQYPSKHPSVRWVGQHMVEFLTHSNYEQKSFLAELAAFEWQQGLCFDGAESDQQFSIEDMAIIAPDTWPQLKFQFHPTMKWLDLNWNIPPYWVAIDSDSELPDKHHESIPTRWLMWRKGMSPHWRSLDVSEAWAIETAANGATFSDICEGLLEWIGAESVAITAAGFLKQWIQDELVIAITLD